MTRPASRRASTAWAAGLATLAALLAAPAPVQGGEPPAPSPTEATGRPEPTDPTPTAPTTPEDEPDPDSPAADPLRVVIDRLTPSTVPERGDVRAAGTISNRSDEPWGNLKVYFLRSTEPITDPAELTTAAAGGCIGAGTRIIDPLVEVPDLNPGGSTRFRITVPRSALELSGAPGVYEVGIHVLGESSAGRVDGADGRACTFLPLVPDDTSATLALGVQLRRPTVRSADGTLRFLDRWQTTFSEGRLRRLLDLGATADGRPLTWVVDPALLDTAQSVARGNPKTGLEPHPAAGPDEEPAEPGTDEGETEESDTEDSDTEDSGNGDGSTEDGEEEPPPDGEPEPDETPEQAAARDWLAMLAEELGTSAVMALPYGDLDAAASVRRGFPEQLVTAQEASVAVLERWDVSSTPALVPPSGLLPDVLLEEVGPETTAVVRPTALPEGITGPVLERTDGGRLIVVQPSKAAWGPGPGPRRSALAVRQRLLADAALHALSDAGDVPLVRLLPPWWDPGAEWQRARFFRGLDVPWLAAGGLGQALSAPATEGSERVGPEELVYPDSAVAAELPFVTVASAARLADAGRALAQLLTENDVVDETLTRQGLLYASVWSRRHPRLAAERAQNAAEIVAGWLGRISVRGPSFVTMSGDTGEFDVTLVNGLDQPVTVGLRATVPNANLTLTTPDPVELPPRGRGAMRIDATATDIGIHLVTLQPVTTEGVEIGDPTTLSIRSSRVGLILWIVMGVVGSLLFVLVAIRITRRVRQRRRTHGPLLKARQQ
ncbi:MAG TPA: DUF6049 family protein [Marmoricola sp.]|nr:DUF6049 family protein [Marmoricola sp.]